MSNFPPPSGFTDQPTEAPVSTHEQRSASVPTGTPAPNAPTPYRGGITTDGRAVAVLVLGASAITLFFIGGFILAIVALALAPAAKRNIAAANGRLEGAGLVKVGVICSWITIGGTLLVLLGGALALVLYYV